MKAVGSSFFLKKKFGVGYRLVCEKSSNCDVVEVTNLLKQHLPDIHIETNVGSELTYILSETHQAKFKIMFKDFEENLDALGVSSFGVSLNSLDDVFLK